MSYGLLRKVQLNIDKIPRLDWHLSIKLAGGNTKLADLIFKKIISSLKEESKLLKNAIKSNNFSILRESIHKLHGACCYTGLLKLKFILKKLEKKIVLKNRQQIIKYIELLNKEIKEICGSNY